VSEKRGQDHIERLAFRSSGTFSTVSGAHRLFDSAYAGGDIAQSISVVLQADEYDLETAQLAPTDSVNAVIHRLRRK